MSNGEQVQIFNEQLDRLLQSDRPTRPGSEADLTAIEPGMMIAAARLAALNELLPRPDAAFEQRIWARLQAVELAGSERPARPDRRAGDATQSNPGWLERLRSLPAGPGPAGMAPLALRVLAIGLVVIALVAVLVLPGPRQALATWVARFQPGRVPVAVVFDETPRPALSAESRAFASVAEAEAAAGFDLLEPAYLPAGFALSGVEAVYYAALPAWLQPLYVEASYRPPAAEPNLSYYAVLREFNASQSGGVRVGEIEFQSETVRNASDVTLAGDRPAVLVEFAAASGDDRTLLRQVIWEQEGLTLELWSETLPAEEMLRIAASLH